MDKYNFTFAIDCDEVLRKTLDRMVELYNKHFNGNKTRDDVKDFKCENSFPEIESVTGKTASEWFFQEHSTELFLDTEPFPHIKEDINTLRKYGKVVILTYQKSYQNKIETLLWLEKQGIECDGICFLKDKTLLHTDYLIDDNDWNFIGSHVKHGILVDAPYNKEKDVNAILFNNYCETLERCHDLHDFVVKFEKAIKDIEEFEKKYPLGNYIKYELKRPIDYTLRDGIEYHRTYGEEGDTITLERYYISGTIPKVRVQLDSVRVTVRANDLDKYISKYII